MGTMTLDVGGWCKHNNNTRPEPVNTIHFHISQNCHLLLEQAEEELQKTHEREKFLEMDPDALELEVSPDCGPLADCQFRVYLDPVDHRGHFHLVGHRASDNSLVYSNAVMVDALI